MSVDSNRLARLGEAARHCSLGKAMAILKLIFLNCHETQCLRSTSHGHDGYVVCTTSSRVDARRIAAE